MKGFVYRLISLALNIWSFTEQIEKCLKGWEDYFDESLVRRWSNPFLKISLKANIKFLDLWLHQLSAMAKVMWMELINSINCNSCFTVGIVLWYLWAAVIQWNRNVALLTGIYPYFLSKTEAEHGVADFLNQAISLNWIKSLLPSANEFQSADGLIS